MEIRFKPNLDKFRFKLTNPLLNFSLCTETLTMDCFALYVVHIIPQAST